MSNFQDVHLMLSLSEPTQPSEEQHRVRRNLGQIGHLVTVCPECGVNNLWTKSETINGETYYYQLCASCEYKQL